MWNILTINKICNLKIFIQIFKFYEKCWKFWMILIFWSDIYIYALGSKLCILYYKYHNSNILYM